MRKHLLLMISFSLSMGGGCSSPPPAAPSIEYRPAATIRDIMTSVMDPSADVLWAAVVTTIDEHGTHEKSPQTDAEWEEVRRHTITVMEATNLLLVPWRRVARPGEKSAYPEFELEPEVIETLINQDRASWNRFAHELQTAAERALRAVDAKNAAEVFVTGGDVYEACTNCHAKFWYPNEAGKLRR